MRAPIAGWYPLQSVDKTTIRLTVRLWHPGFWLFVAGVVWRRGRIVITWA